MTLDKAIKRGTDLYQDPYFTIAEEDRNAIKLGTQAMLRIQSLRQNPNLSPAAPLPSETEE